MKTFRVIMEGVKAGVKTSEICAESVAPADLVADSALPLFVETITPELTRKSAFKKKQGTAREWKPND